MTSPLESHTQQRQLAEALEAERALEHERLSVQRTEARAKMLATAVSVLPLVLSALPNVAPNIAALLGMKRQRREDTTNRRELPPEPDGKGEAMPLVVAHRTDIDNGGRAVFVDFHAAMSLYGAVHALDGKGEESEEVDYTIAKATASDILNLFGKDKPTRKAATVVPHPSSASDSQETPPAA